MNRRWLKLACGCSVIIPREEMAEPGQIFICNAHGQVVIERVNRLKG